MQLTDLAACLLSPSQYFANDVKELGLYRRIVDSRSAGHYLASYEAARRLGISGLGLSRLTSSLLVQTADGHKTNIGLSLKFESKGLKVLGYSRKLSRGWEFTDTAVRLMQEYKVRPGRRSPTPPLRPIADRQSLPSAPHQAAFPEVFRSLDMQDSGILRASKFFPTVEDADKKVKEIKKWLETKGVNNFDPVALFAEQLDKVRPTLAVSRLRRDAD